MPFIPNTPESLLRRADSKNPASTCKGITISGAHCRRSIHSSRSSFLHFPGRRSDKDQDGVLAVLEPEQGSNNEGAAAYFCWQHKNQAAALTSTLREQRTTSILRLSNRTSQDTLVERLGVLNVESEGERQSRGQTKLDWEKKRLARKDTLPKEWQDVDGPLLAIHDRRGQKIGQPRQRKDASLLSALCCLTFPDIDEEPPARVHESDEKSRPTAFTPSKTRSSYQPPKRDANDTKAKQQTPRMASHASPEAIRQISSTAKVPDYRPKTARDPPSQTQTLLSLLPKTLSPQTTSLLLAELAKPISPHDEPGYIYIFWLTPSSERKPTDTAASSLLSSSNDSPTYPTTSKYARRRTQIIGPSTAAQLASPIRDPNNLLLKIGRASNVQRRMNEWTRQCGYNLSLMRFYPYVPSSSPPSPLPSPSCGDNGPSPSAAAQSPTKVPHAHKVERLIHLELADLRIKKGCDNCGRCHQEWFEVEGTPEGVKKVDEVVRRWVAWGEKAGL